MYDSIRLAENLDGSADAIVSSGQGSLAGAADCLRQERERILKDIETKGAGKNIRAVKVKCGEKVVASVPFSVFREEKEKKRYTMAYLYAGSAARQIEAARAASGCLTAVSPGFFSIRPDGALHSDAVSLPFIRAMHGEDVRVVPFLSNHWNREAGEKALEEPELLADHVARAVRQNRLDGVNIDIENLTEKSRADYAEFIRLLRARLPEGSELSVAVAANPEGKNTGWQGSYDYAALAQHSDHLLLMAYDEHSSGGVEGPVASLGFVERSVRYAVSRVPPEKIVLGIPLYGRVWSTDGRFQGEGIGLVEAESLLSRYNAIPAWEEEAAAPRAQAEITPGSPPILNGRQMTPGHYTVWLEDERSLEAKVRVVSRYRLKGAGFWALGQEPPDFWAKYAAWLASPEENGETCWGEPGEKHPAQFARVTGREEVRVRSGGSTRHPVLRRLPGGTRVEILGKTPQGWCRIRLPGGGTGYINGRFLRQI